MISAENAHRIADKNIKVNSDLLDKEEEEVYNYLIDKIGAKIEFSAKKGNYSSSFFIPIDSIETKCEKHLLYTRQYEVKNKKFDVLLDEERKERIEKRVTSTLQNLGYTVTKFKFYFHNCWIINCSGSISW